MKIFLTATVGITLLSVAGCGASHTASITPRSVGAAAAHASAWPEAMSDAAHASATAATGPSTAKVAWSRKLEGVAVPGPAIGLDGSVLVSTDGGVLHALDPVTGKDRWTYGQPGKPSGEDLSVTPAILGDGTILWPSPGNQLVALTPAGKELWTLPMKGFVLSPALASGGRVYLVDMSGQVEAVDTGPGDQHSVAWTIQTGSNDFGSPAVAADGTLYTTAGKELYAIEDDGTSARVKWTFTAKDAVEVSPAVTPDGTVILGSNNDVEYGITPAGKIRWTFAKGDYSYSSPVVSGGKAYFGDHLDVVDAKTGMVVHRDLGIAKAKSASRYGVGPWTAPLVDARGDVYFGTAAGHIYGYGPDGTRLWDLDASTIVSSYPALTTTGLLIIGDDNGIIRAIG